LGYWVVGGLIRFSALLLSLPFCESSHKEDKGIAYNANDNECGSVISRYQSSSKNHEDAGAEDVAQKVEINHFIHCPFRIRCVRLVVGTQRIFLNGTKVVGD
jgi:hypothetical protein